MPRESGASRKVVITTTSLACLAAVDFVAPRTRISPIVSTFATGIHLHGNLVLCVFHGLFDKKGAARNRKRKNQERPQQSSHRCSHTSRHVGRQTRIKRRKALSQRRMGRKPPAEFHESRVEIVTLR